MPKYKPDVAEGWMLVPKAATRSHLDSSSVRRWCRIAADQMRQAKRRGDERFHFRCELVQDPEDLIARWHIEQASFMAWHRLRNVKHC